MGKRKGRGLSLFSGGLDSQLAVCVLREQGLHVEAVVFKSPFFKNEECSRYARNLGVNLHELDFTNDILSLVETPPHGFGNAMNPCIDCHALMIQRAGELMESLEFDFVATGEVLNQRPMSQNRQSLLTVARCSTIGNRLLRPLSAKLLEPTEPELAGLVEREHLLDLSGRSRKPQMQLAARFGLRDFPAPAGGCRLTERSYCRKVSDLLRHKEGAHTRLAWLLNIGRHFRLPENSKAIVGRHQQDNQTLLKMREPADIVLLTPGIPGPVTLLPGGGGEADIRVAAALCAAYSDCQGQNHARVSIETPSGESEMEVRIKPRSTFAEWML